MPDDPSGVYQGPSASRESGLLAAVEFTQSRVDALVRAPVELVDVAGVATSLNGVPPLRSAVVTGRDECGADPTDHEPPASQHAVIAGGLTGIDAESESGAFRRSDVSAWPEVDVEAAGLDEKQWLCEPGTRVRWLFKPVVVHADGTEQGEDWAEKLVSELGRHVGVPRAEVALAVREGRRGCLSRSVCPDGWEMQPGQVLLAAKFDGYRPGSLRLRGRPGHSLANIAEALDGLARPPQLVAPAAFDAFDVFAGYLVLDALVANRDRHDENWSILHPPPHSDLRDCLASSYDHAGSLGFNLRDTERERRLRDDTVDQWARRGTAWRFEHVSGRPDTLVRLAADALARAGDGVRGYWLDRIDAVGGHMAAVVDRAPEMSEPARTFALRVLETNRRRILDEC